MIKPVCQILTRKRDTNGLPHYLILFYNADLSVSKVEETTNLFVVNRLKKTHTMLPQFCLGITEYNGVLKHYKKVCHA